MGALGISCGPLLGNDCSCSWGQLRGWRGAVAIPGVESPCFPSLQGRELGTMIISGESCFCPILILYQITFLSVPCPVSLATLRAYCVLDNGNTAMNNTKSPFSWSFLFRISRNHSLVGFPNISKHSPDLRSGLPEGLKTLKAHSVKSDHSQTGGENLATMLHPAEGPQGAGYPIVLGDS